MTAVISVSTVIGPAPPVIRHTSFLPHSQPLAKIATKLEVHATPLDQALAGTLAAYRANPAS